MTETNLSITKLCFDLLVKLVVAPGARLAIVSLMPVSGSVTATPVRVSLPVFVTVTT